MRGPKEIYFVEVVRGTGRGLRYGQKGGGLFSSRITAQGRRDNIAHAGVETKLYRATVVWEEVTDDVEVE